MYRISIIGGHIIHNVHECCTYYRTFGGLRRMTKTCINYLHKAECLLWALEDDGFNGSQQRKKLHHNPNHEFLKGPIMAIIAFDNHVEDLLLSINKVWLVKKKKSCLSCSGLTKKVFMKLNLNKLFWLDSPLPLRAPPGLRLRTAQSLLIGKPLTGKDG